ncbi:uncharacterized protein LOC122352859 isoform X2 [Puntigrus tetrazona]|uniref:uncharacterized protein LOC122352859 isoform X2 n=1 Tax=Puntigrus tetrazona TaxID=1606681 RepID=UPI001C8ADF02|nr:uncharacterized protein LOC122352859 isoform X2 [Puntigrus tetrazona]
MCVELSLTTGHAASLQMSREDCETKREVNTVSYRAEGRRLFDMWIFFVFLAHISSVASLKTASAGESVTFHCSHFLADGNVKYFCRESCVGENILIRSETGEKLARTGRYALLDEGSDFTVTVADLRPSDSGTYVCGVDRFLKDTYSYIILSVIEVSTLTPVRTSSTRPPPRRTTTDKTDLLVHVGASFGALVLVFTVILFIFIKLKHKQKKRSSGWTPSTHQPDFPTYAAPNITAQTDSLNYSCVQFVKGPDCGVKIAPLTPQTLLGQTSVPHSDLFIIIPSVGLVLLLISAVLLVVVVRKKRKMCELHVTSRKREENAYERENPTAVSNIHPSQSDAGPAPNDFHSPPDPDLDYVNAAASVRSDVNPDQIYTQLDSSRQSQVYESLRTSSVQKASVYHSINQAQ